MSKNLTIEQITAIAVEAATAAVLAAVGTKPAKASTKATTKGEGASFGDLRNALKAHKASGVIPAGVSVKQAIEQGLMTDTGALPGKASKKAKPAKASKKVEEGTPFHTLQLRLREHKANGLVVPGVSVRQAQAEGLIDEDGNFLGASKKASKKAKPAKAEKVAAKVEADAPAKVRAADGPRRADGSITPKSQWDLRESLADSGKFDRHEIDAIVEPARA